MLLFYIIFAMVLAITIISLVVFAIRRERDIYKNGIEVDSVVVEVKSCRRDGSTRYTTYVKYVGGDGNEHKGVLNVSTDMPINRKVRIKYLPDKYDYVVFVSQEL